MTKATTAARAGSAVRIAVVGLLGTLALTACDSGGSGSGSGSEYSATATPSARTTASAGHGGGTTPDGGELDGSWLATTDGRAVVLIVTGEQAALFSTDRTTCKGTAGEAGGKHVIRLGACEARTTGTVESVNRTTLRITWEGGPGEETYTRSEGPALPSGLPTASLGS